MKFSVLMSIYFKEKEKYFDECLSSLYNQTVKASEIVIVQDGPIGPELQNVIEKYKKMGLNIVDVILEKNCGLGLALSKGVPVCSYDLIARMDSDDIAREDRFEIQTKKFIDNPNLDICGSQIIEFIEKIDNEVSKRIVPTCNSDIYEYQKKRDAFNHMTVMFKKETVLSAGNYQDCPLMEDTLLWINMMKNGANCANIDECLVYARVGKDMYKRRGGFSYFKKYRKARKIIYKTGYISWKDYFVTIVVQFIVAMIPNNFRKIIYSKFLR